MLSRKRTSSVVGLDIEAGTVAGAEVRRDGAAGAVKTAIAPLEPGAFHEGEVADLDSLGSALRRLFSEHRLGKAVRLGIANQRVAVRTLRVPRLDDPGELEAAVRFQAQEHLPMPLDEAILDYAVTGEDWPGAEGGELEVVAVAARRDMVERLLDALRKAGLRPVGIDLSAFGMLRALAGGSNGARASSESHGEASEPEEAEASDAPAKLYCSLGDVTNLAVARGARCLFTRVSTFGAGGIDDLPELAGELRLSLEFYATQDGAVPVEGVVVCGSGSTVPGLAERLREELDQPVEVGRASALGRLEPSEAARLTVPYGLALEE